MTIVIKTDRVTFTSLTADPATVAHIASAQK